MTNHFQNNGNFAIFLENRPFFLPSLQLSPNEYQKMLKSALKGIYRFLFSLSIGLNIKTHQVKQN